MIRTQQSDTDMHAATATTRSDRMNPNDIKSRDELYELHDGYADKEGNRCHDDGYRVRDWFEIDAEDRIVNYFGPDSDGVEPTFRDPS